MTKGAWLMRLLQAIAENDRMTAIEAAGCLADILQDGSLPKVRLLESTFGEIENDDYGCIKIAATIVTVER